MPQLSTLSARKAAATLPRHVRRSHRTASRVAGAAKPRTLSTIKALVAPPNDDTARFLPSTSSLPSSSTQNVAPRVRVFEKLASAVAINVSQMRSTSSLSLSLSPFKKKKQSHTILLYQMGKSPNSRTFADFPSPPKAADGCIASFEESLKLKNATKSQISYAASDLHAWLDSLPQAGALVFDAKVQAYVPFDKAWLKQQVLLRLQELARAAAARQQGQGAAQGGRRR